MTDNKLRPAFDLMYITTLFDIDFPPDTILLIPPRREGESQSDWARRCAIITGIDHGHDPTKDGVSEPNSDQ